MSVDIGEQAPDFTLPDTAGDGWSLAGDGTAPTVLVFTCNHCPYALAWHDRIADAARDYAEQDVRFLAINANDAERYPRDSYEAMQSRVAREEWPMPYLHDPTQQVARGYRRQDHPRRVRARRGGAAALPRRPGLRPRRSRAAGVVAARGAGRRAGRPGARAGADHARGLLDQVEAVDVA
jgi:peroxiredoxin